MVPASVAHPLRSALSRARRTGGKSLRGFGAIKPNSQKRYARSYGVARAMYGVKPDGHPQQVLDALAEVA